MPLSMKPALNKPGCEPRPSTVRRGVMLLEMLIAGAALGVALTALAPMVLAVQRAARLTEQRRMATHELCGLMERVVLLPAAELTVDKVRQWPLSPAVTESLDSAELIATLAEPADGLRKVTLELKWFLASGTQPEPSRLVAWVPAAP